MSQLMSQNALTPRGNNNLNFSIGRDQIVQLQIAAHLSCQPASSNYFFSLFVLFLNEVSFPRKWRPYLLLSKNEEVLKVYFVL